MKFFLVSAVVFLTSWFARAEFDEKRPYGRLAFFAVTATQEQPLTKDVKLEPGQRLVAHADSNAHCFLLVVARSQDRQLVSSIPPVLVELGGVDAVQLPEGEGWDWSEALRQAEVEGIFFPPGHPKLAAIQKLIAKMKPPTGGEDKLWNAQADKLRQLIAEASRLEPGAENFSVENPPVAGGLFRGPRDDWRGFARRANFSHDQPAVISFRAKIAAP